jgi:hypothetical protein
MHLRRLQHELADLQRQVSAEIRRLQPGRRTDERADPAIIRPLSGQE